MRWELFEKMSMGRRIVILLTHGSRRNGARTLCSRLRNTKELTDNFRSRFTSVSHATTILRSIKGITRRFRACLLSSSKREKSIRRTHRKTFIIGSFFRSGKRVRRVTGRVLRLTVSGRRKNLPSYVSRSKGETFLLKFARSSGDGRGCTCRRVGQKLGNLTLSLRSGFQNSTRSVTYFLGGVGSLELSGSDVCFCLNLLIGLVCSQLISTSEASTTYFRAQGRCQPGTIS